MVALVHTEASGRPQRALKLVKTRDLDREAWLAVRRRGIGSSDAAAAVGLSPYTSQLELWLEKTGRDGGLPAVDPNDETSPMYWGTLLEPIVASHYTRRTGNRVRRINAVLQHPTYPWMLANIDREVLGAADVQILECKTAGVYGSLLWKEGVPEYVQLQVMHQLAVTGHRAADVAVLLGGQVLEVHRIVRDEDLIDKLTTLEEQFWRCVETDTPPPADGSESAERALRCLYPRDSGRILDLSEDRAMSALFADLVQVRQTLVRDAGVEAALKQRIQERMGDATRARFETGEVTWKRTADSTVLDVSALTAAHPALVQGFTKTKPGARRFVIVG